MKHLLIGILSMISTNVFAQTATTSAYDKLKQVVEEEIKQNKEQLQGKGQPAAAQPQAAKPAAEPAKPAVPVVTVDRIIPETTVTEPAISKDDAMKMRDPYRMPVLKSQGDGVKIAELERFPIDQFKLVGIIAGTKRNKAMLVGPDNRMHIVGELTRIGTRKGVVKKIKKDQVLVHEKIVNVLGNEETLDVTLEFKDKDKGRL